MRIVKLDAIADDADLNEMEIGRFKTLTVGLGGGKLEWLNYICNTSGVNI